jgi:uncharacterized protein
MQRLLALAAAALLVTQPLSSQAQVSTAKKELVQKVMQLQQPGIEAFARAVVVEQPVGQMMQAASRVLQDMPESERSAVGKAIEGDARKYVEEMSPAVRERAVRLAPSTVQPLIEDRLNEDELKTLIAWLESPVSRKYGQLQPEMQRALASKLVAESRPSVEPKLKALEAEVAKRLGVNSYNAPASGAKPAKK